MHTTQFMNPYMQTFTQRLPLFVLLFCCALNTNAQQKTSTLYTLTGKITFEGVRVYLIRDDFPPDYPFAISDLSMDHDQGDYMVEDSVLLRSTGVNKILKTGIRYENPEVPIEKVTVVKQYKIIVRDTLFPPVEQVFNDSIIFEASVDSLGAIEFSNNRNLKPANREVKKVLKDLIDNAEASSFLSTQEPKKLYKQKRGKCSSCVNWNFELDRIFIRVNYDLSESDQRPLVLELKQISRP